MAAKWHGSRVGPLPAYAMEALNRQIESAPPSPVRIVEEALAAVFHPARVSKIVEDALELAGLETVPERPTTLRIFVEGALFAALSRELEISDALEVLAQVRSSLENVFDGGAGGAASSDIRAKGSGPQHPRSVLVATQASLVVFLLQDMLGESVEILPASGAAMLAERIERMTEPLLLLVDRKHPCVGMEVLRHLSKLPAGSSVIWWGGGSHESLRVESALTDHVSLVPTHDELRLADLGEMCRVIVGLS